MVIAGLTPAQAITAATSTAASVLGLDKLGAIAAGKSLSSAIPVDGTVRLLVSGLNQNTIGNGLVAHASFRLSGEFKSGSSTINAGNCAATDVNGTGIFTSCTAGAIKYATCDVNADGVYNVADVQIMVGLGMLLLGRRRAPVEAPSPG